MSTRCNIRVIDGSENELWFYRHSDGYPSSVLPSLEPLMERLKLGGNIGELSDYHVRDNIGQFGGWIILLGHIEYGSKDNTWKVGAYEPTTTLHGDIEYLYTIDLEAKTLTHRGV